MHEKLEKIWNSIHEGGNNIFINFKPKRYDADVISQAIAKKESKVLRFEIDLFQQCMMI